MPNHIKHSALRTFVVVAELGNIVAASAKLGRTPSAISMALKQLEEALGGSLFESDRKSKLTALGQFVLAQSRLELQSYDRVIDSMRAFARNQLGTLKIACVPSVAQHIIPEVLSGFLAARPGIDLELRDADTLTIVSLVESGEIDIGVGGRPSQSSNLKFEILSEDNFVLVCSDSNSLAQRRGGVLRKSEILRQSLIRNDASDRIDLIWLQEAFSHSKVKVRNVTSLLSLVRQDLGVAILPELSLSSHEEGICKIAMGNNLKRATGFITSNRTSTTPLASAFRTEMKAFLRQRRSTVSTQSGRRPYGEDVREM